MSDQIRILSTSDVRQVLPMSEAIDAMKTAFAALSSGSADVPLRTRISFPSHDALALVMPACVAMGKEQAIAVKVVSIVPENARKGLPVIEGVVMVMCPDSGNVLGLLHGGTLTAIRTGAASGLATDLMAREDSRIVAIIGAGIQARTQLEAVCMVRTINTVWVYDVQSMVAEQFASEMAGKSPIPADLRVAESSQQAVEQADIICTATGARSPVLADRDLKVGVHINAVGSHEPDVQEIPSATVARALLVVDSYKAALAEAGEIIQAISTGLITDKHVGAELGELVLGSKPGRNSNQQVTLFKSVGVAAQDAVAASLALHRAEQMGIGHVVEWN